MKDKRAILDLERFYVIENRRESTFELAKGTPS
jgi:hypothetical protein